MNLSISSHDEIQLKQIIKILKRKYKTSYDCESFIQTFIDSLKAFEIIQKLSPYTKCKNNAYFCLICNNNIKHDEYIRKTPCNHIFHKKCLDKLIISYNFTCCPHCYTSF